MTNEDAIKELRAEKNHIDTHIRIEGKDPEYYEEMGNLSEAMRMGIEALEERPQGEWIPVSEKLPESRDWYLGLFKEHNTDFIGIPYICDYVGKVTKGTTNEGWIIRHCTDVDTSSDYFRNLICVAWHPFPEPCMKGGSE